MLNTKRNAEGVVAEEDCHHAKDERAEKYAISSFNDLKFMVRLQEYFAMTKYIVIFLISFKFSATVGT